MNNDLISRSALRKRFSELCPGDCSSCDYCSAADRKLFCGLIDDAPAVDAVEVVRCKDCEFSRLVHREDGSVFEGTLHCFTGRGYQQNVFGREYSVISPNNFCASGRRKMDADKAKAGE